MKMSAEQDKNFREGLKFRSKRHAQKKGMGNWTQCTTKAWTGCTSAAMEALQEMDSAERKLASMGIMLLLSVLVASGQGFYVIEDTNQLRLIPSSVKVTYRTNLFEGETVTFVSTNWITKGTPEKMRLPNGTWALAVSQDGHLTTNVDHRITFANETRIWKSSQTFSLPVAKQTLIVAAPPETVVAVPTRNQR